MTKPKHPGGRPTAYKPEYCERIIELMAEGRSLDGCAPMLGVHPDSLYEWQHRHPEFSGAVRAGRAAATAFWENRLLDIAQGGPGNAQSITWALRNRSRAAAGWHHDVQKLEHAGHDGGPIRTEQVKTIDATTLDPDAREALKRALLAAKAAS